MRKAFISVLALLAAPLFAQQPQLKLPRASQHAVLTQTVGLTDVTIVYSRPGVKGRKIWGGLVPWGQVWRTGANEATTFAVGDDVTINGEKLPKGTYSLHTIPGETEWTLIFNSVANQWGSFTYDQAKDTLRVKAKPEKAEFREWLTFEAPDVSLDSARFALRWENLAVPFTVNAGTTSRVIASARDAVAAAKADDWSTSYRAASFAFDNGMTEDAGRWLDTSLKAKQTTQNLYLKARMQAKAGDRAGALKTGEQALQAATDKDKELSDEVRKSMESWKK